MSAPGSELAMARSKIAAMLCFARDDAGALERNVKGGTSCPQLAGRKCPSHNLLFVVELDV